MRFAYLDFVDDVWIRKYSRFHAIAQKCGATIDYVTMAGATNGGSDAPFLDKWDAVFEAADVLILKGRNLPAYQERLTRIYKAIKSGKSALIDVNPNAIDGINGILAKFDIVAMPLRINDLHAEHPRLITLQREDDCLRSLELFAGVDQIVVQQPNVILYGKDSMPLAMACGKHVITTAGDLPSSEDHPRLCACIAGWCGPDGQVVVAISGSIFHDPGPSFPGIIPNERFAENLIRYLSRYPREPLPDGNMLCDHIEENLARAVLAVLQHNSAVTDWWTKYVPLPVRKACAVRKEEEGNRCTQEAYLNLIDLKSIIEKNWPLFEPLFQSIGIKGRKAHAVDWIADLNSKYRRMAGHPLKRAITGFEYAPQDLVTLRKYDERSLQLRRAAETQSHISKPAEGDASNGQ